MLLERSTDEDMNDGLLRATLPHSLAERQYLRPE
jgi:hypothetical protein